VGIIANIKDLFGRKPPIVETAEAYGSIGSLIKEISAIDDDLTNLKGADIYKKMQNDPDVKIGLLIKTGGVLSQGWDLSPGLDEEEPEYNLAVEQMDYVQSVFDAMPGSLDDVLECMLEDALGCGVSIAEKNYRISDGKVSYSSIKTKDPAYFKFVYDDYMNLVGLKQQVNAGSKELDPSKFIYLGYNAKYGEIAGISDLRSAYKYWWAKDKLTQWMLIHAEKYAMPTAKGTYAHGLGAEQQVEILRVLERIKTETALLVPDSVGIELLEAKNSAQSIYLPLLEWCGKQIIRSILGQTLTTDEGARSGSLALGQVHQNILGIYIKKLQRNIEEFVNEQIIRDLIDYNWAVRHYPNFMLRLDEKDINRLADVMFRLTQAAIVDPGESWIREYLGIPDKPDDVPTVDIPEDDDNDAA
jgi:phage gp29-like protein